MVRVDYFKTMICRLSLLTIGLHTSVCMYTENNYTLSATGGSDNPTDDFKISSEIQCAALCAGSKTCTSFAYKKEEKRCFHSSGLLNNTGYNVYFKKMEEAETTVEMTTVPAIECPSEDGYQTHTSNGNVMCTKFSTSPNLKGYGASVCAQTGGHLLLIENEAMFNATVELLNSVFGPTYEMIIDGQHTTTLNDFADYKGDVVPYMVAPVAHPTNALCLIIADGMMKNSYCSASKYYICQFG